MKKMKYIGMILGVAVAMAALTQRSEANPITGQISFSGGVTLNTGSVNTATAVTSWTNPVVTSDSGSFASIPVNLTNILTLKPWSFNSGPLAALWSVGGFTFNLISSAIVFQGGGGVFVSGTGTIVSTNSSLSSTTGTWTFSASNPGAGSPLVFSFQAATGALAPDGGLTVTMLGGALIGLQVLRRKIRA